MLGNLKHPDKLSCQIHLEFSFRLDVLWTWMLFWFRNYYALKEHLGAISRYFKNLIKIDKVFYFDWKMCGWMLSKMKNLSRVEKTKRRTNKS